MRQAGINEASSQSKYWCRNETNAMECRI